MDVRMPVMDGVAAIKQIKAQFPELKVLVLTTFDDDEYITQAMRHGAMGYLLKDTPSDELAHAIHNIHKGYTQIGPGLFQKLLAPELESVQPMALPTELSSLTPREQEVLHLIATGANNREIAQSLYFRANGESPCNQHSQPLKPPRSHARRNLCKYFLTAFQSGANNSIRWRC